MPLHHYKQYDQPRMGLFSLEKENGEYDINKGVWEKVQKPLIIIGEDDHNYIEEIVHSTMGIWRNDKVIQCSYTVRLGPHKTRLIRWLPNQLKLF